MKKPGKRIKEPTKKSDAKMCLRLRYYCIREQHGILIAVIQ